MFKINEDGFTMGFRNGWTVSVQWHQGAYSDAQNSTAEVAAWDEDGKWWIFDDGDTVAGWQTPEEVAEFLHKISQEIKG